MVLAPKRKVYTLAKKAWLEKRRLVAPLVGFPGCDITGQSIKVAQQNHGVHYACIKRLVDELEPDAAFMMMDLSVEANALGLPVRFPTDESSTVEKHPIQRLEDLEKYADINILYDSRIQSYIKTVEMLRIGLPKEVLVCGYVIGPFTLAGLLRGAQQVAIDSILDPETLHGICRFTTNIILDYASALINAGADLICILEPTGAVLGPEQFKEFSSYYVQHIIESCKYAHVETIYHICGNTMHLVKEMAASGVSALSLDSPQTGIDMAKVAEMVNEDVVIIGNVNPTAVMKDGSVDDVIKATRDLQKTMSPYPNFIMSTGCDLPPGTPIENIKALVQTGRYIK